MIVPSRSSSASRGDSDADISGAVEVGDDSGPVDVEAEPELAKPARRHRLDDAALVLRPGVEHEEPSATCSHELAADRAGFARGFVVLVDGRVGHLRSELTLVGPVLVEELAVRVDVAGDEDAT